MTFLPQTTTRHPLLPRLDPETQGVGGPCLRPRAGQGAAGVGVNAWGAAAPWGLRAEHMLGGRCKPAGGQVLASSSPHHPPRSLPPGPAGAPIIFAIAIITIIIFATIDLSAPSSFRRQQRLAMEISAHSLHLCSVQGNSPRGGGRAGPSKPCLVDATFETSGMSPRSEV